MTDIPPSPALSSLTISRLSLGGDGVTSCNGKKIYIPLSAPGDIIEIGDIARKHNVMKAPVSNIISESVHRDQPACRYYGSCGGCNLQHISESYYRAYKDDIARRAAVSCDEDERVISPSLYGEYGKRKRAVFSVHVNEQKYASLCFSARDDNNYIAIDDCIICTSDVNACIPLCTQALNALKKPGVISHVAIDVREEGVDIVCIAKRVLKTSEQEVLTQHFSAHHHIARVSVSLDNKNRCDAQHIVTLFSRKHIHASPGSFSQPTKEGAEALRHIVVQASSGFSKAIDLFSGSGHYALALAERGIYVDAYEGDADMIRSAHNQAITLGLSPFMEAFTRDLYKNPVPAEHLRHADIVIINPPRNGALPQCKEITASAVSRIVMLSCNASAYMRDGQHLVSNGYRLTALTMIDQFYRNPHVELAAVFDKI